MSKELSELQQLFTKYLDNTISPPELNAFWQLVAAAPEEDAIHSDLKELWAKTSGTAQEIIDDYDYPAALRSIKMRTEEYEQARIIPMRKAWGWAVAAIIILFISAGAVLFHNQKQSKKIAPKLAIVVPEIIHCKDCATLTLGDGTVIELDSAASGNVAEQGSTQILKLDAGQLAYKAGSNKDNSIVYNTISTPKGGTYQIILPDGSKVWLNAASSIKFPTSFIGGERRVDVTGEAFFEVMPNLRLPFKVLLNGCEIQVLGTSFNVNGYTEEEEIQTTLVEGSIRLKVNKQLQMLKPGQQLSYHTHLQTYQVTRANIEEVLAWKEGFFYFNNANIQTIMRQIGRWYNVNIEYEGKIPTRGFKGEIGRDLSLVDVVDFLKKSKVNVILDGKTLKIRP